MKNIILIIFLGIFGTSPSWAQSCAYFPADCPDNETLQQQAEKKWSDPADLKVKEEYAMQDMLRNFMLPVMQNIAKEKNWKVYQFTEDQDGGIGMDGNTKPVPYPLRRPCQWGISFVFIVNEDSLRAWQTWYNNDLQNAMNTVVDSYKQSGVEVSQDENRKKYLDSANYYGDLKAKYMTAHAEEYQKAILAGDKKGQKKFEDGMKKYDDKINAFIEKTNGKAANDFSASKSQFDDLETYKHKNTIAYRNASIIRVSLEINNYIAPAGDNENKKIIKQLSLPGASLGLLIHNNAPDEHEIFGQYLRSPDVAMFLFGKWILKQDEYHSYHAVYFADKKNTDAVSMKKTPCDKVQTIILHIEGDIKYINQLLQVPDLQKLNDPVVKN